MEYGKAYADDIARLCELRIAYLKEDFGVLEETDEKQIRGLLPGYFQEHLNRDLFVYTAEEDGRIIACAFLLLVVKPMSPSFLNGKTGMLLNVYTEPAYRRKGIGRTVLQALIKDAEEMEFCSLELKATEDGYPLYRKLGFAKTADRYRNMKLKLR
ncbi:MAG: GNAT family N-acetyltransferase [Solobacterium sp.]|nr:GNAT family N-acetyltransferase [Solobacterium sp.]